VIDDATPTPPHARFRWSRLCLVILGGALMWALPMGLLVTLLGWSHTLTQMAWFFTKAAFLTFGGAYAVLPYVYQGAVLNYGWLTPTQMIDGLALGETTPGPLIMVVAFVAFIGAYVEAFFGPQQQLLAGTVAGHTGPGRSQSPISIVHATLAPGARLELPWRQDFNALVYALTGRGSVGAYGQPINGGQLAVLGSGDHITLEAAPSQSVATPALDVLLLGGVPLREPVFAYGPFVMNTKAEVVQAIEDYQRGRLGVIPEGAIMPVPHSR
jgi:hypothetical protein